MLKKLRLPAVHMDLIVKKLRNKKRIFNGDDVGSLAY